MDKDKLQVLNLIMDMWQNDLIEGNGIEDFENWCEYNIENKEQRELINRIKDHVNAITYILNNEH